MKKILLGTVMVVMATVLVSNNAVKAADATPPSAAINYAVINIIEIMNQSKAVNDIKQQINVYKANLQKQAEVEQSKLKQDEQNLIKKQGDMTPKAFDDAKVQFQTTVQTAQKGFYDKSAQLDKVSNDALVTVQNKIGEILSKIAKDNKYDVVFQSNALAYYPNGKDLTKMVIDQLNKSLTKVQVKKPF